MITTTQILPDFNIENIQKDFDIYRLEHENSKDKLAEDNVLSDANETLSDSKILAVSYGKKFTYLLAHKGANLYKNIEILKQKLKNKKKNIAKHSLISACFLEQNEPRALLNLLLNFLAKSNELSNINAALYYVPWAQKSPYNILKISAKEDAGVYISLEAKRAVNVEDIRKLKNKKYINSVYKKENSLLKRCMDKNEKNAIVFGSTHNNARLDYLALGRDFMHSKIAGLYYLLSKQNELKKYLSFTFRQIKNEKALSANQNELNSYFDKALKLLENFTIYLVDLVADENSSKILEYTKDRLSKLGLKVKFAAKIKAKEFNLAFINAPDFYEKEKIKDPYKIYKNAFVQHFITEPSEHAIKVILINLVIKYEIIKKEFFLLNWKDFGFNENLYFSQLTKKENKPFAAKMSIKPSGEFNFAIEENNLFNPLFTRNFGDKMICSDSKSGSFIKSTKIMILPNDINEFFQKAMRSGANLSGEELIKASVDVDLSPYFEKNRPYEFKEYNKILKECGINGIRKTRLNNLIIKNSGGKKAIFQSKENSDENKELFGGLLGVHYWQNGDNYEYCVGVGLGNVGQINGYKIEKSPNIKRIEPVKTTNDMLGETLALLGVGLVRLNAISVYPFAFKYLREFLKMEGYEA